MRVLALSMSVILVSLGANGCGSRCVDDGLRQGSSAACDAERGETSGTTSEDAGSVSTTSVASTDSAGPTTDATPPPSTSDASTSGVGAETSDSTSSSGKTSIEGSTGDGSDDTSGGATGEGTSSGGSTDQGSCAENEFVDSNACVACPDGTVNEPGDDPTDVDTTCEVVYCAENEFVESNACVACPAGATNDAGDDASGVDTECDDDCTAVLGVTCSTFDQGMLKSPDTDAFDEFGSLLAISGDTLVVGARFEDGGIAGIDGDVTDNSTQDAGAAYVFVREDGEWALQAYLKAGYPGESYQFATSVAIDGDTIVVGSRGESGPGMGVDSDPSTDGASSNWSGAANVYVRSAGVWMQQAYLKASNPDADDWFGSSVAVDGDTLVVGAPREASAAMGVNGDQGSNSAAFSGAAYVFARTGATWTQEAYLKASNTAFGDNFGYSVDVSGDTIVVGAVYEDGGSSGVNGDDADNSEPNAGSAFVYARTGSVWTQQAYLKASNTQFNNNGGGDYFGWDVAIDADTIVVAAPRETSGAIGIDGAQSGSTSNAGAAYVFTRTGSVWMQQAYVKASNTDDGDFFGSSVALHQNLMIVGAPGESSNATGLNGDQGNEDAAWAGAAYVYRRVGPTWSQLAYLKASNTEADDHFGVDVAVAGGTVAIGAMWEDSFSVGAGVDPDNNSTPSAGAAYVRVVQP